MVHVRYLVAPPPRFSQANGRPLQARRSHAKAVHASAHRGSKPALTVCEIVKSENPSVVDRLLQVSARALPHLT